MTTASPPPSPLSSSDSGGCQLGRHDYWEATYATELANLSLTGDEGEVWFGDAVNEATADFAAAVILREHSRPPFNRPPASSPPAAAPAAAAPPPRVVDVGCGNGALVFALADRGFGGVGAGEEGGGGGGGGDGGRRLPLLVGVDYSPAALALAAAVAARRGLASAALPLPPSPGPPPTIGWVVADLVADGMRGGGGGGPPNPAAWALPPACAAACTDKGTLDAVRLSPSPGGGGGGGAVGAYLRGVAALLRPGGLFIVTSCNATLGELRRELCGGGGPGEGGGVEGGGGAGGEGGRSPPPSPPPPPLFSYVDHVRTYPTFKFGGVEGSRVATVAVRKR